LHNPQDDRFCRRERCLPYQRREGNAFQAECRGAKPHLFDRGAGTIVSTCSVKAVLPDPLVINYSAAKVALLNFSKSLLTSTWGQS
jgi:NAD(P)-dependent dehydrogenase (short-subunit alcohol dehydrogenase family)